jgi:hypothetical protein
LDVEQRVTTWIRLQGILAIALPTGVLLWLYSLVIDSPKKILRERGRKHANQDTTDAAVDLDTLLALVGWGIDPPGIWQLDRLNSGGSSIRG